MKTARLKWIVPAAAVFATAILGVAAADDDELALHGKGLAILPVALDEGVGGKDLGVRFAEVLGIFLERGGAKVTAGETGVAVKPGDSDEEVAERLSALVEKAEHATDFTLLVSLEGLGELKRARIWLADRTGMLVLSRDESEFPADRPKHPMAAMMFLAGALREASDLDDPNRPDAPEGAMAERMRKRSGVPPKAEVAAMEKRWAEGRETLAGSKLLVYPFHSWKDDGNGGQGAGALARKLREAGLTKATAAANDPKLVLRGDPNQLRILWDAARGFRTWLKAHPPEADYALFVDAGSVPKVRHLHLVLCNRAGDWLMVDLLNSHKKDFNEVAPDSLDDCAELAKRRFMKRLEENDGDK